MPNLKIEFLDKESQIYDKLKFSVIAARYKDKWILCKHKDRTTWEIPGGHIEDDESHLDAAHRELFEETGAVNYALNHVCFYNVKSEDIDSFGALYFAEVLELGNLPDMEIDEIKLFELLPKDLTYPIIQPLLHENAVEFAAKFKELSDMTLEELHQLFPVILTNHSSEWVNWYNAEKNFLQDQISQMKAIHHYGSTAIPNIKAKPTIDIMIEVSKDVDIEKLKTGFQNADYFKMTDESNGLPMFAKGYTKCGFAQRVYHVHLRYEGQQDELIFRDYLCDHPDAAKEYEQLKIELKNMHEFDRDAYTDAKYEFICNILDKARIKM